jgi:hypothetical protein
LLLKYLDHQRPEDMAGLVAATPREAALRLAAALETVHAELKRLDVGQEAIR